jgi:hypothetical protein
VLPPPPKKRGRLVDDNPLDASEGEGDPAAAANDEPASS